MRNGSIARSTWNGLLVGWGLLGSLALLFAFSACRSGPRPGAAQPLPQQYVEKRLRAENRTEDGGVLYRAELSAANANALSAPYAMLQEYCKVRSGGWVPIGPSRVSAAEVGAGKAPNDVGARLSDADSRGFFGVFRCESSGPAWHAIIEPSEFETTTLPDTFSLSIYVKAASGSAPDDDAQWPPAPGPAAALSGGPGGSTSAGPEPERIALPPGAQPAGGPPSSPLNQQPSRPAATGDKVLADPRPFGINMGSDSPEVFASKLRLDSAQSSCASGAHSSAELCFAKPGGSEALDLRASFVETSMGPVVSEFTLRYPPTSFVWVDRMLRNDYGAPDFGSGREKVIWNRIHTRIELSLSGGEAVLHVTHAPSLDRARLPAGAAGRDQAGPIRLATPWQLQLGYEPAQLAQSKLQAAGFTIASVGCKDGGPHARPVLTRSCPLNGGRMDGLRSAEVINVDVGDGRARLAQLSYQFDKRVLDATLKELRTQYGEPLPGPNGSSQWWTGPVGVEVAPHGDTFQLRYFHGRLMQLHDNAQQLNESGEKASQKQGF